jgi:hypothetical protein
MSLLNPLNWFSAATDASVAAGPPYVGEEKPTAAPAVPSSAPAAPAVPSSAPSTPAPAPVDVPSSSSSKPRLYFPAPPLIQSFTRYQDVNNDSNLQHIETLFFLERTQECIKRDKSWKKFKKFSKYLKGDEGYEIMHKLLRLFVKRGNTNWYDLKMQQELVMDFIKFKLSKIN